MQSRRCDEYGHTCNYERDVRKRGRKPATRTDSLGVHSSLDHHAPTDCNSPESTSYSLNALSPELLNDDTDVRGILRQPSTLSDTVTWPQAELGEQDGLPSTYSPELLGCHHTASGSTRPIVPVTTQPHFEHGANVEHVRTGGVRLLGFTSEANLIESAAARPYKCLESLIPLLPAAVSTDTACELLEFYFAQPGSSLFRSASPYVLTHIIRKRSLLDSSNPRPTTLALLSTMIWVSAQTADLPILLLPGERTKVCEALRELSLRLVHRRDRDNWVRLSDGSLICRKRDDPGQHDPHASETSSHIEPTEQVIDDVLTFLLICIVVSGGDFKHDCQMWWNKAVRLSYQLKLSSIDAKNTENDTRRPRMMTIGELCQDDTRHQEELEERRRVFWLIFCLDRHLALSYNSLLSIRDDECEVFIPLPEDVWSNFESASPDVLARRTYGPPTTITGTG